MKQNTGLDELLTSYLLKESNAKQEAYILKWINSDDANQRHFEELKKALRFVNLKQDHEKINLSHEWEHFQELLATKEQGGGSENEFAVNEIIDDGYQNKRSALRRVFISVAVAASILLIIGLSWKMFIDQRSMGLSAKVETAKKHEKANPVLLHKVNNSNKPVNLVLPDGSEVILEKNSELIFTDPFPINKRDVTLKGKANFKVANDKGKPFSVFSGELSTTALGTAFTVTAYEYAENIVIRLYEGKVVIKSADSLKRKLKKSYYLIAGQELIYNNKRSVAKVRAFEVSKAKKVRLENRDTEKPVLDNPSIPLHNMGSWYMFNNQSLSQVFDQLESMYGAHIVYNKQDIRKLYFIGKFNKSESLENILRQICALNNLTLTQKNNRYLISKNTRK